MTIPTITFTPEDMAKFKHAYKQAIDTQRDRFMFQGMPYYIGYARYLILTNAKLLTTHRPWDGEQLIDASVLNDISSPQDDKGMEFVSNFIAGGN